MAIVSIYPWFEVPDGEEEAFEQLFTEFYYLTSAETGMNHYGFCKHGNQFHCRESYTSAEAALAHIENVGSPLGIAAAHLKSLEFHGPRAEIDKLREPTAHLNPTMYELEEGLGAEVKRFATGGQPRADGMLSIVPYFEVPDEDIPEFQGYIREFLALTARESGCLYYGFTRSGNNFHCREAYKSADDGLAHLQNVDAPLQKAGKYLKSLKIMGPEAELEKIRPATEALGTTYWALDQGSISRMMPYVTAGQSNVVYAQQPAAGSVVYAAAPAATVMPAGSITYAAPQVTYAAPSVAYAQPVSTMTYGAPAVTYAQPVSTMTYAAEPVGQAMTYAAPAPAGSQPVYTISPERFQLIMQGQPLTNEEIAQMTGAAPAQAVNTMVPGASASIVMPGQSASFVVPGASASIAAAPPAVEPVAAAVVTEEVPAPPTTASTSKKDSSKKKSSKKKLSSKKKEKGCC